MFVICSRYVAGTGTVTCQKSEQEPETVKNNYGSASLIFSKLDATIPREQGSAFFCKCVISNGKIIFTSRGRLYS
jgi:hypothetical protein